MYGTKTLEEKRDLLARLSAQLRVAIEQPGTAWYQIKMKRDQVCAEIAAMEGTLA